MDYFLPSFVQKRLLRYALSRLELVDTDAIDLDSLGIRWGQRSTFELRDIGLRLQVGGKEYSRTGDFALTSPTRTETSLRPTVTANMQALKSTHITDTSNHTCRYLQ